MHFLMDRHEYVFLSSLNKNAFSGEVLIATLTKVNSLLLVKASRRAYKSVVPSILP